MRQTPWHLNTSFPFHTAAGWLWCSHQVLAISGFSCSIYLEHRGNFDCTCAWQRLNSIPDTYGPNLKWIRKCYVVWAKLTFAVNSVVINIWSTDIGSKLRAGYQQASWNTEKKSFVDRYLIIYTRVEMNIFQSLLTCAYKRVKDKVILFNLGMVGHDEWQPSIHTGVPYEVSVFDTVGANKFTLPICYLARKLFWDKCWVEHHLMMSKKSKDISSHPSTEIDVVWLLGDVVGVCAIIFQQTEDVLRVLQAHCAFKWKILQSLQRENLHIIPQVLVHKYTLIHWHKCTAKHSHQSS